MISPKGSMILVTFMARITARTRGPGERPAGRRRWWGVAVPADDPAAATLHSGLPAVPLARGPRPTRGRLSGRLRGRGAVGPDVRSLQSLATPRSARENTLSHSWVRS